MQFHLVEDYKKIHFSQGLLSLWSGKILLDFGLNIFGLFLPIILYQAYGNTNLLIAWFISHSLGYFLLAPLGGQLMNKIGIRKSLYIGVLFRIPYFLAFYHFASNPILFAVIASLSLIIIRSTFWLPFLTDSAKFSSRKNRGKQFSVLFSISSLLAIIAPVLAGFLMNKWGFTLVTIVSMIISIASMVPFLFLPKTKETLAWTYGETFKYFFHPFNRRMVGAYMADGAVGIVNGVFWPLFLFFLLDGKYNAMGMITGAILLAGLVIRLIVGNFLDKFEKLKLVRIGTILNSSAWLIKTIVVSALHVFLASLYHTIAIIVLRTSLDTLVYEKAADRGHYIDEYTLIKEMAIHFGKILILVLIAGMLFFFPLQVTFIIAAVFTLFVNLLK
ncbi:MAG: MFS transporter [Candidatus Komeilibacteria bacterium]|nr:MFS transporter [Candidatus Komeilibacteria bacterium]